MYIATKRLYVDKDYSQIVEESSPQARYLLAHKGQPVEDALAERLGLFQPVAGEELPAEVPGESGEGDAKDPGELTPEAETELVSGEQTPSS